MLLVTRSTLRCPPTKTINLLLQMHINRSKKQSDIYLSIWHKLLRTDSKSYQADTFDRLPSQHPQVFTVSILNNKFIPRHKTSCKHGKVIYNAMKSPHSKNINRKIKGKYKISNFPHYSLLPL